MKSKFKIYVFIFVVLMAGLALWSPWYTWNLSVFNLFGISSPDKYSGLKVKSLSGELEIFIDGQSQGSVTDNEDFADIYSIKPGIHEVELKRKDKASYYEYKKDIEFYENTEVVTAFELGPNEYFTEGHILYAMKNYVSSENPMIYIETIPDMTKVYLDGIFIGETPINGIDLDLGKQHKILLEKVGYNKLEFTILPETIDERNKLKGKNLRLEAKLFLKPVMVVER